MKGLIGKLFITGEILLKTGLHIGGSTEGLDIGGVDIPIVRDVNDIPFIPGSSLKGKMRSLLEWKEGKFSITIKLKDGKSIPFTSIPDFWKKYIELKENNKVDRVSGNPCKCGECDVCRLFGVSAQDSSLTPSRLIARDAFLDIEKFRETFKESEVLEREYGEVKFENTIDRITSSANPRQIERVPAGAVFNFMFVLNLYGDKYDKTTLQELLSGMKLLEDDYLGGSGTRGYGQIKFQNISIKLRDKDYYTGGKEKSLVDKKELSEINIPDVLPDINKTK